MESLFSKNTLVDHLWFDDSVWASTFEIDPEHLIRIFTQIIEGPFMSSEIAAPLMSLALNLIEKKLSSRKSVSFSHWSNLSSSSLAMCSPVISPHLGLLVPETQIRHSISTPYFGAWILFKLFLFCAHLRVPIARYGEFHLCLSHLPFLVVS